MKEKTVQSEKVLCEENITEIVNVLPRLQVERDESKGARSLDSSRSYQNLGRIFTTLRDVFRRQYFYTMFFF